MEEFSTRVTTIFGLADSKKIADRKKFLEDMQNIYANDEFVGEIHKISAKNLHGPSSWNEIAANVHRVILSLTENTTSKVPRTNSVIVFQSGCCALMLTTVSLATSSSTMYLGCADLMAMVFQILEKEIYQHFHDTYINILVNHVLTNKFYRMEITSEQWREILRLGMKMYRDSSDASKSALDLVRLAVQYGCLQSHLLLDVKKMMPFLEKILEDIGSGKETMLKPVYKLTYVVCLQIGTESCISLCGLSEKCLPHIVPLVGCPEKYGMMLLLVQMHHPGGMSTNDDGTYACDWELWKNIIRGIHANIVRDIKQEKLEPCFLKLACEVYRQIMQDSSDATNESSSWPDDEKQPHKRKRLSMVVQKPIDILADVNLKKTWPFIQILTVLLRKYPNSLKSSDYVEFLKIVTDIVIAMRNKEKILDSLCELCTVLLQMEKEHFHEIEQTKSIGVCWENIWDIILRALTMNQNEVLGHKLLQSIIEHRNVANPTAFLRLYLTNAIKWSLSSVETLLNICKYVPVPSELSNAGSTPAKPETSGRELLVGWAMNFPSLKLLTRIPSVSLANLLTGLMIKSWYKREYRETENFHDFPIERKIAAAKRLEDDLFDEREVKVLNDIERCHLALIFRQNLVEEPKELKTIEINVPTLCDPEVFEFLLASLTDSLNNRLTEETIGIFIQITTVVAKILSNFAEFNVRNDPRTPQLINLFVQTFKNISELLTTIDTTKCQYLLHIVEALEVLYCTRYHWKMAKMIVEQSSTDFIKFVYELILEHGGEPSDGENVQSFHVRPRKFMDQKATESSNQDLSDSCRIKNAAHRVLTYYCCAWIGEDISVSQTRVLKDLMKIDIYEATSNADLRRALTILKALSSSEKQLLTNVECLDTSISFLKQLYDSRPKDETAVRGISNVLPHFVKAALNLRRSVDDPIAILYSIHKRLIDETPIFGPQVEADFVECLTEIIRLDPHLKWQLGDFAVPSSIINVLLEYISNPFYLVRLKVVRALYVVFSSKDLDVPWKLIFFAKIKSAVANLFVINDLPDGNEKTDELLTRTITAIHIFASIIRANEFLHSRGLFACIEMSVQRDVKTSTLKKALMSVTRNEAEQRRLIEINLHYLLSRWLNANYPLQRFPWILTDCESQECFSRKYIETLLIIKLERRELNDVKILCNNLDVSFERTVENCFPSIMALLLSMSTGDAVDESYGREILERLRSNSGEFENVKNFDDLLTEKLSDVILDLVKRLHDQEHFYTLFKLRVFLPKSNPPYFKTETVHRCLRYLEHDLPVDGKSIIEYLVTQRPSVLQKVLLTLNCNIYEVDGTDYRLKAFHKFAYFYTEVLEELSNSYFDPMSRYVVRDTSHSLIDLIKEETNSLSEMACTYFQLFLKKSLPARSNEIEQLLSFTVSSLIPIIQSGNVPGAMSILRFLIIDQKKVLADAIEKLDFFPNEQSFEEIKQVHNSLKYKANRVYSLEDEIEHFLNAVNEKTLSCSLEGLLYVKNQLSTRKTELRAMYSKLELLRGFAEDCARSTLHRLIYKLVQLTKSRDADISLEAAKSLGELGPVDLTTMILHPENIYCREDIDNEVPMLTLKVISHLVDYLIESNVELKRASADALYAIFDTSWGREFFVKDSLPQEFSRIYDYIYPFDTKKRAKRKIIFMDRENWMRCIDDVNDLWVPATCDSYSKWIVEITCSFLDCFVNLYTNKLKPVCRLSVEFCENLLPRLVNLITRIDETLVVNICIVINRFFRFLSESINETNQAAVVPDSSAKQDVARSYECVRCMLNVVDYMRIQAIDNSPLALDNLLIAKAAQYCSAYFTSLLYAELWCETFLQDSGLLMGKVPGSWISAIDSICEFQPDTGKFLQDIVRDAYLHIGDPDSIYGCGLPNLVDSSFKTQHYTHLRQWDKIMIAQDVDMSCGGTTTLGMLNALQQSGCHFLLGRMIRTVNKETEKMDDFMYEAAWRLADWNIVKAHQAFETAADTSMNSPSIESTDYYAFHYRALKCLWDNDIAGLKIFVDNARASIIKSLRDMSLECSQTVYPILSQLQMLREIEEFAIIKPDKYDELFDQWFQQDFKNMRGFQYAEPILSQRLLMYRTKNADSMAQAMRRGLIHTHLEIAEVAGKQGYFPIAAHSLDTLTKTNDLFSDARDELVYREAALSWKRNDRDIGRYLLKNLIKKPSVNASLRVKALRVYGNWVAESKSENAQAVIRKYYKESIKTSYGINKPSSYDTKNLTDAQADLAQFADSQYQYKIEFMKSPQYENLVEYSRLQNETSGGSRDAAPKMDTDEMTDTHEYQAMIDAAQLGDIKREKEMYLVLAARYYLLALQNCNRHDLLIVCLVSLWLDNISNNELNEVLVENIDNVASYKFITLLPQLAPHMRNERNHFTAKINDLMERCATEHPHHTLPVLFALKNTYKDHEFQPPDKGLQKRKEMIQAQKRILAVNTLISRLAESPIRPIIQEMSQLSNALIMLAYFVVSGAQKENVGAFHNIPKRQMITKVRNYEHINVPTITLDLRPNGNYDHVIGIREYGTSFEIPGGICAPKKIVCVGTDGILRKQLVKGRDDLRQDAVMQQVCTVMNSMLKASKETNRRKLHIRTYKIVPLSQRSGVLEWCENTLPISNVLCDYPGKLGLHSKYYPNDWTVKKCRSKLRDVEGTSMKVKRIAFLECCKNLHPAFHHFFTEKYPSAETWFERRLAYTRSVATTSMVGYMLGLGDRHFSNILIDQTTAEVIHIDFGIAFAQGKVLPIPETVPFRLTRDMEAAMGICGVEGIMKRCCEETVAVLRDRRIILITLLEVLLYDPLFSWAIAPIKSEESCVNAEFSDENTDETNTKNTNKIAERALLRIDTKLKGREDGLKSSIPGQVQRLIHQARDPDNLCRLYSGWQAYL